MIRWASAAVAIVASSAGVASASDAPPMTFFERLVANIEVRLDAAIVARPPKLVPPSKVALSWKLAKLGSLDLGAPLVALTGGDLDGDGKGELYAVTTRDVIAIGIVDKRPKELGRVALGGERSVGGPRDVVGTAVVDGTTLIASVSLWQHSVRVTWHGGALVTTPGGAGFAMCAGEPYMVLARGRNYFGEGAAAIYGARCASRVVDGDGYPLRARAVVSVTSKLDVTVERCAATGLGCQLAARHEYTGAGVAFEVADLDRDGRLEVLYSGAGAPGDPDTLKVVTLGDDDKKAARLKKGVTNGGVAGLAVTDVDGNGVVDAIVAVRLLGATRVDLWRLD